MESILIVLVILAVTISGFWIYRKFSESFQEAVQKVQKGDSAQSEVISGTISLSLVVLGIIAYLVGQVWFASSVTLLGLVSIYLSIFRVVEVYIAVPYSIFLGRIKKDVDEQGFSIPIRKPYKEGLHFKPFWWEVSLEKRDVKQLKIEGQEYQIGSGGTIVVSGLIQYRVSDVAAYRATEIGEQEVKDGISSEVDQFIIKKLGELEAEAPDINEDGTVDVDSGIDLAIRSRARLSSELEDRLTSGTKRFLFGREITYSEQGYGVEVLKARIDKIEPTAEIKKRRDDIQSERYETRSETIQVHHFTNRVREVKKLLEVTTENAVEIVMLNLKLTTKDIKQFQIDGLEDILAKIATKILTRRSS